MSTIRSLVAADAGNPGLRAKQGFLHGLNFMNITTQVCILEWQAAHILPHEHIPACIAVDVDYVETPLMLDLLAEDQRIPEMIARIEE
jgi:hypothetical protein